MAHAESMREMRNAYKVLLGNPTGKRSLENPGLERTDLKMDCKEICWESVH
jgi:hypothetical protein